MHLSSRSDLPTDGHERDIVRAGPLRRPAGPGELYDLYFPRIYRYMLARTGNPAEAEDVTEEVFIRVLGGISGFQWRQAPFAAWLFRIARNQFVSHARKNGARRQEIPLPGQRRRPGARPPYPRRRQAFLRADP